MTTFTNFKPEYRNPQPETPELPKKPIGIGQWFRYKPSYYSGVLLLAQVGVSKVCLVDTFDANRWSDPVTVKNPYCLSEEEVEQVFGDSSGTERTWELIDSPLI